MAFLFRFAHKTALKVLRSSTRSLLTPAKPSSVRLPPAPRLRRAGRTDKKERIEGGRASVAAS
ncbi:MAG TPA: hypothetical protein VI957_02655 [Candidatus Paceibacterota bacterium]